jgi:predicted protein tyrosine phosphatase
VDNGFAIGSTLRLQVRRVRMANGRPMGRFGGEFGQGAQTYVGAARARYIESTMIGGFMIHVSSLSALDRVTASLHSFDLLTLLSPDYPAADWRGFACERHLRLAFHDIVEPMVGLTAPDRDMMQAVLDFGRSSDDQRALLIHCWAGISRSSAAAYAVACDRNPGFERDIAIELRRRSPSATPNRLMVRLADDFAPARWPHGRCDRRDRSWRRGARRRAVCVAAEMA